MSARGSAVPPAHVYKICTPAEHAMLVSDTQWRGSADDARDGFIHLSTAAQVPGTLARHFAGRGPLVLLEIPTERLAAAALRWERSRGGKLFPHLYGILELSTVVRTLPLDAAPGATPPPPGDLRS